MSSPAPPAVAVAVPMQQPSALGKVFFLIGSQLASRVFTFVLNMVVARTVGMEAYGLASINLYLVDTLILMLTREGFRRGCVRVGMESMKYGCWGQPDKQREQYLTERQSLINLLWMVLPMGFGTAAFVLAGMQYLANAEMFGGNVTAETTASLLNEYRLSLVVSAIAAVVTLCGEPMYILAECSVMFELRASIETGAMFLRCVTIFVLVVHQRLNTLAFALGQLVYALTFTVAYVVWLWRATAHNATVVADNTARASAGAKAASASASASGSGSDSGSGSAQLSMVPPYMTNWTHMLPRRIQTNGVGAGAGVNQLHPQAQTLTLSFWRQSVWKLVLTEGEKMVLVMLNVSAADQGIYGLVQNLGSLVARFLFLPLEESSFTEFSRLLSSAPPSISSTSTSPSSSSEETDKKASKQPVSAERNQAAGTAATAAAADVTRALVVLHTVLKLVILIGLTFISFGPNYSFVLFDVLYSARWSATSAPRVLSVYCGYILFLAVNGITEACLNAFITGQALRQYNQWLLLFSCLYLMASVGLLRFGAQGIVLANCLNMTARIAYSSVAIVRRFRDVPSTAAGATGSGSGSGPGLAAAAVRVLLPALPSVPVMGAFIFAHVITHSSFVLLHVETCGSLLCYAIHVATGVVCLVLVALMVRRTEHAFLHEARGIWLARRGGGHVQEQPGATAATIGDKSKAHVE